jgi:hypothetical protein
MKDIAVSTEKSELLGALAPMRPDIVEIETDATRTSLPDGYQNAAPLATSGAPR